MSKLNIAEAVVFSNRADLRNAVRGELKACEVKSDKMHNVSSTAECLKKLEEGEAAFLVLDWEVGPDKIVEILSSNKSDHRIESHPTFLIAAHLDDNITAVAAEFNVLKVHCGEITPEQIRTAIKEMVRDVNHLSPIRQILVNVEKCRAEGKLAEASTILEKVYEKSPDNTRVALELAENYAQSERWAEAQTILETLKDADPPLARARHLLARCYLKKGDHQRAVESLQGAQLISPYNVERLCEIGNLFLDIERPKDAKKAFEAMLEVAPESKKGTLGKTTSMLQLGELNEALQILKSAANNREIASVFNTSAIISIRQGKHQAALDLYKTAHTAVGNNSRIQARLKFNMGIGFVKWGKLPEAAKCFEEAVKLDPEFTDAAHNLAALKKVKAKATAKAMPKESKVAVGQTGPALVYGDLGNLEETFGNESLLQSDGGSLAFATDFQDDADDGDI